MVPRSISSISAGFYSHSLFRVRMDTVKIQRSDKDRFLVHFLAEILVSQVPSSAYPSISSTTWNRLGNQYRRFPSPRFFLCFNWHFALISSLELRVIPC